MPGILFVDDTIANAELDALDIQVNGTGAPLLKIWDGAPGAVAVDPGNLLASMILPSPCWHPAAGRQKLFIGPWTTDPAVLGGTARSWCIYTAVGVPKLRGDVGLTGSGAFMQMPSVTIVLGIGVLINSFTIVRS